MPPRAARDEDIPAMERLWLSCFSDTPQDVRAFFQSGAARYGHVLCEPFSKEISAMALLLPVVLRTSAGECAGSYLYGVCTHPARRGRGLFHRLMAYAQQIARERGEDFLCLVPEREGLVSLYRSLGYRTRFYRARFSLDLARLPAPGEAVKLTSLSLPEALERRRAYFAGRPGTVLFEKQGDARWLADDLARSGVRAALTEAPHGDGILLYVREGELLRVREAVVSPEDFRAAALSLAGKLGAKRIFVCAEPACAPSLAQLSPYGMLKPLSERGTLPEGKTGYMNLMLDE